jgi:hypothetical protein
MTLIKDLIELPAQVHRGDFVLRLTEGVTKPEETLRDYVVTPQLEKCFDRALTLVKSAVDSGTSKASYLNGSFGSGKSHFMAVLHLLLQGNAEARSKPELSSVVEKHNSWTEGKKFLLVPYHMIGARSLESRILGGYVQRVTDLHPKAPVPGVYKAEALFHDSRDLRTTMGDAKFFDALNRNAGESRGGGWGEFEASWEAESFEAAMKAAPGSDERSRLVGRLIEAFFRSYKDVSRGNEEAYVSLDDGLSLISRHARDLGYSAVVLFLDELILWLATHAADTDFLNTEGAKLSKLVEAETADRPIPIVSFIARQRDLRDLVGEHVPGAQQLSFADILSWWEARFDRITLDDRNLPEIASRRVLKPKSEAARQELERSFRETEKVRDEVMSTLLTPRSDREMFRKVYPFSPALVETLIAVSSVLQRERTALKVMLQLLVNQRDTLDLGEIVPVGDLFDVISEGDEPFTEGMRIHFDNAKRLYTQKLLPMLEVEHGISREEVEKLPYDDAKARQFRTGDRLLKTLLLAALVPEAEVLKGLTISRLTALNHGTVKTPIPGRENQTVHKLCKTWAAQVGEIKLGEDPVNPAISIQLSAVDTESILANVVSEDNTGNRRRKIREILFQELGIATADELFHPHEIDWWGTKRSFDVVYGNTRELTDETLQTKGAERRVIIDFPFDPGHSPEEDLARLDDFRSSGGTARTLVWLPSFLSSSAQKDLGTLVKIDHLLTGERFKEAAKHLSAVEQADARQILENQRSQLRHRVAMFLEGAYGMSNPIGGSVDPSHSVEDHFQSLDPAFNPRPPVGANLRDAFEHLLDQMLSSQYPAHPRFGADVKPTNLRKVHAEAVRAIQQPQGRIDVEKVLRPLLKEIAEPLKLGEMGETHFVLGYHWLQHFNKKQAETKGTMTVAKLRAWMDEPTPMGLPAEAQNLVILLYADQTNRSFLIHGGAFEPSLDKLPDELELREQALPDDAAWAAAVKRAAAVFGEAISELKNATNVSRLRDAVLRQAEEMREPAHDLVRKLEARMGAFDVDLDEAARLQTARSARDLLESLHRGAEAAVIETLANANLRTSDAAVASSLKKAGSVKVCLEGPSWDVLDAVRKLEDERKTAAEGILTDLREALAKDEYAVGLDAKVSQLYKDAVKLLTPPAPPPPPQPPAPGLSKVEAQQKSGLSLAEAEKLVKGLGDKVKNRDKARVDLSWTLYDEK